jgi:hypothetical protein
MESTTIAAANVQTEKALTGRAAQITAAAATPKTAAKRRGPLSKTAEVPAPRPAVRPAPRTPVTRRALTPKERAARPVTATIASYVEWLNREVFGGKMTKAQIEAAGISITLYGAYQVSAERKAARGY